MRSISVGRRSRLISFFYWCFFIVTGWWILVVISISINALMKYLSLFYKSLYKSTPKLHEELLKEADELSTKIESSRRGINWLDYALSSTELSKTRRRQYEKYLGESVAREEDLHTKYERLLKQERPL